MVDMFNPVNSRKIFIACIVFFKNPLFLIEKHIGAYYEGCAVRVHTTTSCGIN